MTYILRGTENPVMSESRGVYPKKYEVNSHGDGTHGRELSWQFKSKLIEIDFMTKISMLTFFSL